MSFPQNLKGRYEIKEILGQGGMGLVYRAYDSVVKRDVALKTLRDAPNRDALQLFYKECEVLAALSHPNIIEIFDIGEYVEEGQAKPFFVMPLLPGATLDKLISSSSHRLTVERVTEMICQACRGLHAAHERGLIHRDIKPSNLFVLDDDSVRIIDFGVAHMVEAGLPVGAKGTLLYMAPEQLQMKPATPASDIYSLGVVCYEALTRRRPFDAPSQDEIVEAVLHRVPPPVCELNPTVSQAMSRVIQKAMAKEQWQRYASAREFSETLQKAIEEQQRQLVSARIAEIDGELKAEPDLDRALQAGDHARASSLIASAEAEFPNDEEIQQVKRRSDQAAENAAEATKLLAQGQSLCAQQMYDEGVAAVRRARELDPDNPDIRGALLDLLVERARVLIDTDLPAAEPLIQEALAIDPAHALAKSLRTRLLDHKRDQAVIRCFMQARQFRAAGELDKALAEAEQCLATYPLDPRLAQLRDILSKELEQSRAKKSRPADPAVLRQLEQDGPVSSPTTEVAKPPETAPQTPAVEVAPPPPPPPAPEPPAAAPAPEPPAAPPPPPTGDLFTDTPPAAGLPTVAAPVPEPVLQPEAAQPAAAPPAEAPAPEPPTKPKQAKEPMSPSTKWAIVGGASAFAAVLLTIVTFTALHPGSGKVGITFEVRTQPPGALVRVDDKIVGTSNLQLTVSPGTYQLQATKDGYLPASRSITVAEGAAPVELTLKPMPQTVRLFTDAVEGQVTLDDQPPRDLLEGQLTIESVAPGKHTVRIAARNSEAFFTFELAPGGVPVVTSPPVVKNVAALVVSSFGNRARIYSSIAPAKAEMDGQPAGEVPAEGLELNGLTLGPHDLSVSDGKTHLKKMIEISPAPVVTAYLQSDQNIGTIVVMAGEEGTDVYIDGVKYRRQTGRGGQLRIPRTPRQYRVRVAKAGFQETAEQTVQVVKGEERRLVFKMAALLTSAYLAIQGAPPGAQVFLDQNPVGTVQADGSFQLQTAPPGEHVIELRRDRASSQPLRRSFAAGQTVHLTPAEVAMRSPTGTLRFTIQPAGAQISVMPAGGGPAQTPQGNTMELDEGSYTVTARAAGYVEHSERVQVRAGQTTPINISLAREQRKPAVTASGMEGWPQGSWRTENEWFIRRGGGFLAYKPSGAGTYSFNLMIASGGGLLGGKDLQWAADYRDDRNYVLFRIDKNEFRRIVSVNGRRTEMMKKPHGLNLNEYLLVTVQMAVTPGEVVNRMRKGEQWVTLDSWSRPGGDFTQGRFAIRIEGRDEIRLSGFSFYPKE
ncbi:MAG: protein kinase domain-containing protein [Rhodospirillales bacterium]